MTKEEQAKEPPKAATEEEPEEPEVREIKDPVFYIMIYRDGVEGVQCIRAKDEEELKAIVKQEINQQTGGRYIHVFYGEKLEITAPTRSFKIGDIEVTTGFAQINIDGYIEA